MYENRESAHKKPRVRLKNRVSARRCGSLFSVGTVHFCDPVQSRTFLRINIPRNRFLIPDLLVFHRETDSNGSDS